MDPLTGVYNRKAFEDKVMQHMSDRKIGCQGAIVLLDVDNFKAVNDQYGHLAGDDVLKHMARCMKNVFSDIGTVKLIMIDHRLISIWTVLLIILSIGQASRSAVVRELPLSEMGRLLTRKY